MDSLSRDYPLWPSSGAQNWLLQSSDRLIKLPRWAIFSSLSRAELEARFQDEIQRLQVYARELYPELIYFDQAGRRVERDARWTICGLLLAKGEPFLEQHWETASHGRQLQWAEELATALTEAHGRAPLQAAMPGGRGAALAAGIGSLLELIDHECRRLGLAGNWPVLRASRLGTGGDELPAPLLHGDLHLANVILIDGRVQFIDPGESLLRISGLPSAAGTVNWDRAALAFSLRKRGSAAAARSFLRRATAHEAFDPQDYGRQSACFFLTLCCLSLKAMAPGAATPDAVGGSAPINELRAHAGYACSLFRAAARLLSSGQTHFPAP